MSVQYLLIELWNVFWVRKSRMHRFSLSLLYPEQTAYRQSTIIYGKYFNMLKNLFYECFAQFHSPSLNSSSLAVWCIGIFCWVALWTCFEKQKFWCCLHICSGWFGENVAIFVFLRSRDIVATCPEKAAIKMSSNFRAFQPLKWGTISIRIIYKTSTICEDNKAYFNNPNTVAEKPITLPFI